jgi:hypothetical protein
MKKQRGAIDIIVIIVLVALFGGIGAGVLYTYKSAIVRAEVAEADARAKGQAYQEQLTDNINLRMLGQQRDALLAERRGQQNVHDQLVRFIDGQLANAYRNDPKAAEWRDLPVPQSVVDSLRAKPAGAGGAQIGKGATVGKPASPARDP